MERKEWLETFMRLVNTSAPTIQYRKYLRLFPKQVAKHLKKLPQYREELATIRSLEDDKKAKANAIRERLAKARAAKELRRLGEAARKAEEESSRDGLEASDLHNSSDDLD